MFVFPNRTQTSCGSDLLVVLKILWMCHKWCKSPHVLSFKG